MKPQREDILFGLVSGNMKSSTAKRPGHDGVTDAYYSYPFIIYSAQPLHHAFLNRKNYHEIDTRSQANYNHLHVCMYDGT